MSNLINSNIIVIRGGGDIATGVVQKFYRAGLRVLILETQAPTAIRRSVSLCEAVYDGSAQVEDVSCCKISGTDELEACWQEGMVPLLIDPEGKTIKEIMPKAVIDAILAKRNLGMTRCMADITIALGPGFSAGKDVHAVIETMRGHDLGRLIFDGFAKPDTGFPAEVGGESTRRVIHSPADGTITHKKQIGSIVEHRETLFAVDDIEVCAPFSGLLRGLIREGIPVKKGMKVADVDPRTDVNWRTISDKARCIGGAALEAYYCLSSKNNTFY